MPRPKHSDAYPAMFKDILIRVGRDMRQVEIPELPGYKVTSLRTGFYAYFRAIISEGEKAPAGDEKRQLAYWAKKCIVRIHEGKLHIANRDNDALSLNLEAALAQIGFEPVDPLEGISANEPPSAPLIIPKPREEQVEECSCGGYGCEKCQPTTEKPSESIPDPDLRLKELTKKWLQD